MSASRRDFLKGLTAAGLSATLPSQVLAQAKSTSCSFHLAVINDEITQDFERACQIASKDFGLQWIELREMWNKNIISLDEKEIAEARRLLQKYQLRVTDIASPLFKVSWPDAPTESRHRDQFNADVTFKQQDELLERCIELTKAFNTDRIRCFDFWRLKDQKPYRAAMNEKLRKAAERCAKDNIILLLENEMSCNTATGDEAAALLEAIPNKNFMLNWDPGNAGAIAGNVPYPNGYSLLPKERIGHCHCKDVKRGPDGKSGWQAVGQGEIDWVGQFRAMQRDGYRYAVSLETHWRGGGTPEECTRTSMQGLKDALKKADLNC